MCVQNLYNIAYRPDDELIDALAEAGIAYVPFFPLGGFNPLQSAALTVVAARPRRVAIVGRADLASAPLAEHPADPWHLVGGAPTGEHHRRRNLLLSDADFAELDTI